MEEMQTIASESTSETDPSSTTAQGVPAYYSRNANS
jgi:hypothetical protein